MTNQNSNRPAPRTAKGSGPARPYHYFVAVLVVKAGGFQALQIQLDRVLPITTLADVQEVQDWVRDQYHLSNPMVVGFSLLRNDLDTRRGGQ